MRGGGAAADRGRLTDLGERIEGRLRQRATARLLIGEHRADGRRARRRRRRGGDAGGAASVVACIGPDVVDGSDGVTADHLKRGIG